MKLKNLAGAAFYLCAIPVQFAATTLAVLSLSELVKGTEHPFYPTAYTLVGVIFYGLIEHDKYTFLRFGDRMKEMDKNLDETIKKLEILKSDLEKQTS